MTSKEAWRTLEGTELHEGVVLRELVDVRPSPVFRAQSRTGQPLLVRFWGKDYGNPQTIVDRHREAAFMKHPGLLPCVGSGLASSGDTQYAYAAFQAPDALLADFVQEGPLPTAQVQALGGELADALEHLHSRDLVYCALDPWTVAKKDGRWQLADYSQMRLTGDDYAAETRRLLVSFPATPPEAYDGKVTPAWDSWSLAHVLRTALLGVARRTANERAHAAPDLPEPFAGVLSACTVMNPAHRCTVREIAQNLQRLPSDAQVPRAESDDPRLATPAPVVPQTAVASVAEPSRSRSWDQRRIGAAAALSALLLLALFWFGRESSQPQSARERTTQTGQAPAAAEAELPSPIEMPAATEAAATSTRSRSANEAEIRGVVDRWVSTFRSGDLRSHLSLYTPTVDQFYRARQVPLEQVRRTKQQALEKAGEIRTYDVENVRVSVQSPTRATVSLDKTYEFAGGVPNSGKVRSELYLRKINETWRIAGERDVRVYWQRKA
jgi:ketosteroid isomerase-like protein